MNLVTGILIPFLGTTAGAACVLFMKKEICPALEKALLGFAAGIMTAAAIWSLLIPAIDRSADLGSWAFLPAAAGFSAGVIFFLIMDRVLERFLSNPVSSQELPRKRLDKRTAMLLLSVTLHNIPEGLAVGVAFAGVRSVLGGSGAVSLAEALVLAVGIAVQNIPEGAIISMPLKSAGFSRKKAFLFGTLSGVVEPLFAAITLLIASMVERLLPFFLSFAAGAMVLVVVEELVPEAESGSTKAVGTLGFAAGFLIMMILDVTLG